MTASDSVNVLVFRLLSVKIYFLNFIIRTSFELFFLKCFFFQQSLCRDLEKEGMKEWLDLMLEKVAVRVSDDAGPSSRDKEFKAQEKKRLQALIDRHDKLMPSTQETQAKVEIYARCYAYGDDISSCLKTLEEMRHLSVKEIHPHNMNMVDEQIEKAEKVSQSYILLN